jgi:Holliday junction resolvase RusA-like endonuclease
VSEKKWDFQCFIPISPPGINETYKITSQGGVRMYKVTEANDWSAHAALIIGSEAAIQDFELTQEREWEIRILFSNWRQDVDAPVKLVIDTVAIKLGVDDRCFIEQSSKLLDWAANIQGVLIKIRKAEVTDAERVDILLFSDESI